MSPFGGGRYRIGLKICSTNVRGQPGGEKFGYPVSKQVVSEVLSEIWLEGAELESAYVGGGRNREHTLRARASRQSRALHEQSPGRKNSARARDGSQQVVRACSRCLAVWAFMCLGPDSPLSPRGEPPEQG